LVAKPIEAALALATSVSEVRLSGNNLSVGPFGRRFARFRDIREVSFTINVKRLPLLVLLKMRKERWFGSKRSRSGAIALRCDAFIALAAISHAPIKEIGSKAFYGVGTRA